MEHLDLARHAPHEYEGKVLVVSGVRYVVGPRRGLGHALVNAGSRLALHVARFVPGAAPNDAPADVGDDVVVLVGAGGRVELHPDDDADALHDDALLAAGELVEAGDLDGARAAFERILERAPEHSAALVGLAEALDAAERPAEALERLGRAIAIEPHLLATFVHAIELAASLGRMRVVMAWFAELAKTFPRATAAHDVVAEVHLASGRPAAALALLDALDAAAPRSADPALRARVEAARAEHEAAAPWLARAAACAADDPKAALALLERAHAAHASDPVTFANIGLVHARLGDPGAALEHLLGARDHVPPGLYGVIDANVGFCLLRLGRADEGVAWLASARDAAKGRGVASIASVATWVSSDGAARVERVAVAYAVLEAGLAAWRPKPLPDVAASVLQRYRIAAQLDGGSAPLSSDSADELREPG